MMRCVLAALAILPASAALVLAQTDPLQFPQQSPTLQAAVRHGEVRLGVSDDSPPLAWMGRDGRSTGYAVDVCRQVAADLAAGMGLTLRDPEDEAATRTLAVRHVHLPVAEQAAAVADGRVDLDCSASPADAPYLASSPALAVSGTRLLVARRGPVATWDDLAGRTVAIVAGMRGADAIAGIAPGLRVTHVQSPGDGYGLLATGAVDAFAADDLVLAGLLATHTDGPVFEIVDAPVMQGPLVIRYRSGDPAFAALVGRTILRMRADGALRASYMRWFTEPLPQGAAVDRRPSPATDAVLGRPAG